MNGDMTLNINGVDITLKFNFNEISLLNQVINELNECFGTEEGGDNNDS